MFLWRIVARRGPVSWAESKPGNAGCREAQTVTGSPSEAALHRAFPAAVDAHLLPEDVVSHCYIYNKIYGESLNKRSPGLRADGHSACKENAIYILTIVEMRFDSHDWFCII